MNCTPRLVTLLSLGTLVPGNAWAQQPVSSPLPLGAKWYVSWGYNSESYAPVTIHFEQPSLGNDFTISGAHMHDAEIWDFWNAPITVPQYSIRIGRFIKKNTAIELNFDHAKAILATGESAHLSGVVNGAPADADVPIDDYVQKYKLNNGANFLLVNLVQRFPIFGEPGRTGSLAFLAKAGLGITIPHTENTVLGQPNSSGFQLGGFGAGLEAALRFHVYRPIYLEVAQKGFYGRYRSVNINQGNAAQDLWAYVTIVSLGVTFGHLTP